MSVNDLLLSSSLIYGGATITVANNFAPGVGILLDPPVFASMSWILASYGNTRPGFLDVWIVDDPDPTPFSAVHLPSSVVDDAIHVVDGLYFPAINPPVDNWALHDGDEAVASFDLDLVYPLYAASSWQGQLQVVWQWLDQGAPLITEHWYSSYYPGQEDRVFADTRAFVRGLSGDHLAWSRKDRCPRCGRYDLRERFTPDGYQRGLLVCRDCWDPEDPPTRPIPPDIPPIND